MIVGNNAASGEGPIQTYDLSTGTLVNSFVPDGARSGTQDNGRAVGVVGNEVFYMDLRMPRMEGAEATRRIRAEIPDTQVLVLTTYADDESLSPRYTPAHVAAMETIRRSPEDCEHWS